MELSAGQTIPGLAGEYRCLGRHGEGGFAVAYAAERVSDGEKVILKELRIERLRDWKSLELFEREAAALRSLSHPRIPKYYDFFAFDGDKALEPANLTSGTDDPPALILVQERLDGRPLQELVESSRRFTSDEIVRLLRGLLEIVRYLHELHPPLIHRDINPNNVLLGEDGEPYLVDFGGVQDRLRLSTVGSTQIGTVGYMPIEQLSGAARAASDLYAIGMTMLTVVSHQLPHEMPIDDQTSKVKVEDLLPTLDRRVSLAIDAMVEPIAAKRPSSAAEVLRLLDGKPVATARRGRVLAALAFALASVGVAAAYLLVSDEPASDHVVSGPVVVSPSRAPATPAKKKKWEGVFPTEQEAGFETRRTKSQWKARVRRSERLDLGQGVPCIVAAEVETFFVPTRASEDFSRVLNLQVDCAGKRVYEFVATEKSNPFAAFEVGEFPGDAAGTFRHTLYWTDTAEGVEVAINTKVNEAKVLRQGPDPSRLELFVERLGTPSEVALYDSTAKRKVSARSSQRKEGVVTSTTGPTPAAQGSRCNVEVFPVWQETWGNCGIVVDCNEVAVYQGTEHCPTDGPLRVEELEFSNEDNSPQLALDLDAGSAGLKDRGDKGDWEMRIRLDL